MAANKMCSLRLTAVLLICILLISMFLSVHPNFSAGTSSDYARPAAPNKNDTDFGFDQEPYNRISAQIPALPHCSNVADQIPLPLSDPDTLTSVTADPAAVDSASQPVSADEIAITESIPAASDIPVPDSAGSSSDNSTVVDKNSPDPPEPVQFTIKFHGNGGFLDLDELTFENIPAPSDLPVPRRAGKSFDGWFIDIDCTAMYNMELTPDGTVELYAGWSDFPGFVSDDSGYITGYTDSSIASDGLLVLPTCQECLGVSSGAFMGLEDLISEAYIPANIIYLEPGAFDNLIHLFYFEAASDNPVFYSREGILYYRSDDTIAAYPQGRS